MILNPYTYNNNVAIGADFSGLNITRLFGVFKTNLATIDYAVQIVQTSGLNTTYNVFFDSNGEISMSSKVGSTTPTSTTLQNLADLFDDWDVVGIYCQITGIQVGVEALAVRRGRMKLIDGGNLTIDNGKATIRTLGVGGLRLSSALTELNDGNNYSISSITTNSVSNGVGVIVNNSTSDAIANGSRFNQLNDNRSNKAATFLRNTAGVNHLANYINQQNLTTQKRLVSIVRDANNIESIFNGTSQGTVPLSGSFNNDEFRIGAQRNDASALIGGIQFISAHNTDLSPAQLTSLDAKKSQLISNPV